MSDMNRQILLVARPVGDIKDSDFKHEESGKGPEFAHAMSELLPSE